MESLAQVGVQLLLFSLGLEFSLSKLRAVRSVALAGKPICHIAGSPCRPEVRGSCRLKLRCRSAQGLLRQDV